jgi:CheY-like chemotaxis protein
VNTPEPGPPVVLVVEDIDWIRAGMRRSLARHGFRVVEAANDSEAVEVARRERPDLILTEEELPTFDALLAVARELPSGRGVPVVVVNPDADSETRYGDAVVVTDYGQLRTLLLRT